VLATQDGAIRQREALEQLEVVISNTITNVNGSTRDGSRSSMELSTWVSRLKHVPIRVNKISHPQAVVGTMHHVTPLEPVRSIWIPRGISAPKVISYMNQLLRVEKFRFIHQVSEFLDIKMKAISEVSEIVRV